MLNIDQAMVMFVELAIGDVLGAPLEFQQSRNPEKYITDFEMGGAHFVKLGEWFHDTFVCRRADGEFISRGFCFDIRNTTRNALERFIAGAGNQ